MGFLRMWYHSFMKGDYKTWDEYSAAQKREVGTACVLVELGGMVRSNLASLVSTARTILLDEARKLSSKKELSPMENKCLGYLRDASGVDVSVAGLRKLEELSERALSGADLEMVKILMPVAKRCWESAPSFLKFLGFGQLVHQKAVSKFVEFALTWRYTGKGYEAPKGMSEPFPGYDAIINSLMGHPLCKARMEREAKAWQDAYDKNK